MTLQDGWQIIVTDKVEFWRVGMESETKPWIFRRWTYSRVQSAAVTPGGTLNNARFFAPNPALVMVDWRHTLAAW